MKSKTLLLLVSAVALLALTGCKKGADAPEAAPPELPPVRSVAERMEDADYVGKLLKLNEAKKVAARELHRLELAYTSATNSPAANPQTIEQLAAARASAEKRLAAAQQAIVLTMREGMRKE